MAHSGTGDTVLEGMSEKNRSFIITWNNPDRTPAEFIRMARQIGAKKLVFQLERGEENGTPHYQGYIYFGNARYLGAVCNALGGKLHLEVPRNDFAVQQYVQKEKTAEDGPWGYGIPGVQSCTEELKVIRNLYPWQQEVVDMVNRPANDRQIHWYWDSKGCKGKTALCKFLCHEYKDDCIFLQGKEADAKCGVFKWMLEKGKYPGIVIFGFPRGKEHFVSYAAMEAIKDGIFFNTKYEVGMCLGNAPHLIVVANFPPDYNQLSDDRWVVHRLDEPAAPEHQETLAAGPPAAGFFM